MRREMDSADKIPSIFVVRVYRFPVDNRKGVVGVVETVGGEAEQGFTDIEGLWSILTAARQSKRRNLTKEKLESNENVF